VVAAQAHVAKNLVAPQRGLQGYDVAPHPDLASAFAAIAPDEETGRTCIKRFHFDEGASQSS
jgi:hypothetical protein